MAIDAGQLRKGIAIYLDDIPHYIVDMEFKKPGKGQALYKCRLKNLRTEAQYERTYRSGDRFETADVMEQDLQYLYSDGEHFHFMHTESFEQHSLPAETIGDQANFMKEEMVIKAVLLDERVIGVVLPNFVIMTVTHADPGVKGDTASGATKPVTMESGYTLNVPLFIQEGNNLRIDTRTGDYVERVNL
jgi:elongation factor P